MVRVWDGVLFWGVRGRDAGIWCQACRGYRQLPAGGCQLACAVAG